MKDKVHDRRLTLKEFTEKYLPPQIIKMRHHACAKKIDYAQLGKDIVDEVRKDLKISK